MKNADRSYNQSLCISNKRERAYFTPSDSMCTRMNFNRLICLGENARYAVNAVA